MPARPHASRTLAVALLAVLLPVWPAPADDEAEQLEAVQAAAEEAAAKAAALAEEEAELRAEIAALTEESIAVAAKLQALEGELSSVEGTLEALNAELTQREAALSGERETLARTLAALVRIALQPPEAVLARPGAPLDMVRSAMLLSVAVPELESRAAALSAELAELVALKGQIAGENAVAATTREALDAERQRLEVLLARKESLAAMTAAEQAAAEAEQARLAEEAEDLKALIAELERQAAERARAEAEAKALAEAQALAAAEAAAAEAAAAEAAAAEAAAAEVAAAEAAAGSDTTPAAPQVAGAAPTSLRDFPSQPGGLFLPASGRLAAGYGEPLPDGSDSSKGFLIETRPGAQIVATYDGRIVYAGAFRRYGLILIIEHSGRYHSLLAGLGRIDVVLGQWVVAGEPVGLMGSPAGESPVLYLELRHNGQPIDPRPWFATQLTKGEG